MSQSPQISSLAFVNRTIDERYLVRSVINRGPRTMVFAVEDLEARDRDIVMRLATDTDSSDVGAAYRAAFQANRSIRHPHIARLYDVGCVPHTGQPYVIVERIRGANFHDAIDDLDETAFCEVVAQVCRALRFMHHRGLAHGGVKAPNVFVVKTPDGPVAKLLDTGLASPDEVSPSEPDSRSSGGACGFDADLKALGAMLSSALLGQTMPADNGRGTVSRILHTLSARLHSPRLKISAEVWAVVRRLVSSDPSDRTLSPGEVIVELANAAGRDLAIETDATARAYLDSAPLCGREEVLSLWSERLESLSRGPMDTPLLMVEAEWGAGKTRLLAEMAALASQNGVRAASRSCRDLAEPDGRRLGEQIDRLWSRFGQTPPVLFLDDLHHLSAAALRDLRGRLRAARCGGGLVVCSCLAEPWRPQPLGEFLEGCEHDETIDCVRLVPLSAAEETEHLARALPATLADDLAQSIRERTGGNPLLLTEVLAHVLTANREVVATQLSPVLTQPESGTGPKSLAELVNGRLARLKEDELQLLRVCALLATPASESTLGAIVGLPAEELRTLVSSLRSAGLLRVRSDSSGLTVAPVPLPVARPVREGRSRLDQVALHRHLARVLERASGTEALASAAEHLVLVGDTQEAARLAGPAAEQLAREGQLERAQSLAQLALRAEGLPVQERRALLELVGDTASELWQAEGAIEAFGAALELVDPHVDRPALPRLSRKCGLQLAHRGRHEEALDVLGQARRDLAPGDTREAEEALIDCAEAEVWLVAGQASRTLEAARRGLQQGTADAAATEAELHRVAGASLNRLGRYREAREQLTRARDLYAQTGDQVGPARGAGEMATALRCLGHLKEAEQLCQDALWRLEQAGSPRELALVHRRLAEIHACQGNWGRAKDHCGQAIGLEERRGAATALSWAGLGEAEVAAGAVASAVRAGGLACRQADASAPATRAEAQLRVGAIWYEIGDLDRVEALAQCAREPLERLDLPLAHSALHRLLGNCCSLRDRHGEAAVELGQAVVMAEETQDLDWLQAVLTDQCAAYRRAGDLDAALASGERATSGDREPICPTRLAGAQTQYARVLHASGRSAEALELLHSAYQTLRRSHELLKKTEPAAALGAVYLSRGNLIYFAHYIDDCLDAFEVATEGLRDERLKQTFLEDPRRQEVSDMIDQAER